MAGRLSAWMRAAVLGLTLVTLAAPAKAVTLLRDAGIEHGLAQLAAPILRAAGMNAQQMRVLVVQDDQMNAFVVDTKHIFVTSGLIERLQSAAELQAVLAHEAAHIANGHLARRRGNLRSSNTAAGLGLALAAATLAATGNAEAAHGIALGTNSAARRNFLAHTRAEESAADLSSVRILNRAGVDPAAALAVLDHFAGQEALSAGRQDPYARSHPLTRERIRALRAQVASVATPQADSRNADYWFLRIQAKLSAFLRAPSWSLRQVRRDEHADIAALREAVAHHRKPDLAKALKAIDRGLALRPRDGFLLDLKAEILLKNRQFGEAARVYARAVDLTDGHPIVRGGHGRALLAAGQTRAALRALEGARARDVANVRVLRDLAVAYARTNQPGKAALVTAERYMLQGRASDARVHATRAEGLLPRGSEAWNRAMDVLHATKS